MKGSLEKHSRNVKTLSYKIGKELGLSHDELELLSTAAYLHDVGKKIIPLRILEKVEKLDEYEIELIRRHTILGTYLLKKNENIIYNDRIIQAVLCHHERIDGTGYPKGLKGNDIPLFSRIIAIADSYDAMISVRSYSNSKSKEEAIEELRKNAGTQFDTELSELFINKVLKRGGNDFEKIEDSRAYISL